MLANPDFSFPSKKPQPSSSTHDSIKSNRRSSGFHGSAPGSPPARASGSHHRRQSSVSSRRESHEMMGLSLPFESEDSQPTSGDPRARALWALEGRNPSLSSSPAQSPVSFSFGTVAIPEWKTPDVEREDYAWSNAHKQPVLPLTSSLAGKRDSFGKSLVAGGSSLKAELHTLLEEDEDDAEDVSPGGSTVQAPEEEDDEIETGSNETPTPPSPFTFPVAPSAKPRPPSLSLRPLSLVSTFPVAAGNGNGTPPPATVNSPRLKSLTLATNFTPPLPAARMDRRGSTSTDKSQRRRSIGYKRPTSPTTPMTTPSSSLHRCSLPPTPALTPLSSTMLTRSGSPTTPSDSISSSRASSEFFHSQAIASLLSRIAGLEDALASNPWKDKYDALCIEKSTLESRITHLEDELNSERQAAIKADMHSQKEKLAWERERESWETERRGWMRERIELEESARRAASPDAKLDGFAFPLHVLPTAPLEKRPTTSTGFGGLNKGFKFGAPPVKEEEAEVLVSIPPPTPVSYNHPPAPTPHAHKRSASMVQNWRFPPPALSSLPKRNAAPPKDKFFSCLQDSEEVASLPQPKLIGRPMRVREHRKLPSGCPAFWLDPEDSKTGPAPLPTPSVTEESEGDYEDEDRATSPELERRSMSSEGGLIPIPTPISFQPPPTPMKNTPLPPIPSPAVPPVSRVSMVRPRATYLPSPGVTNTPPAPRPGMTIPSSINVSTSSFSSSPTPTKSSFTPPPPAPSLASRFTSMLSWSSAPPAPPAKPTQPATVLPSPPKSVRVRHVDPQVMRERLRAQLLAEGRLTPTRASGCGRCDERGVVEM